MTEENIKADEQLATANQDTQNHDVNASQQTDAQSEVRPAKEESPDWREVRHIMKEQRNKIDTLERELSQFKAPPKKEEDPLDSLSEDDVVTVADMKRYAAKVAKQTANELYESRSLKQEIEATPTKYPDYYDVIKYVEPLVKENPALMSAIEKSANPREAAYQMAKMYLKTQDLNSNSAKKIEENLNKPKTTDSLSLGQSIHSGGKRRTLTLEERSKIFEQAQSYASMR